MDNDMENQSINCEQSESLLFDFHEGKLRPELAANVDTHLQQCDACSAMLNDV